MIAESPTFTIQQEFDSDKLNQTPRPYQWEDAEFLRDKKKAIIAHPPGLGKTLSAMMAAADGDSIGIACPSYLVEHWWDEIRAQFPDDSVVLASGTRNNRQGALNVAERAKWTIFNHQMLRFNRVLGPREVPTRKDLKFQFPEFDTLIYDESHHFRNRSSQQARAAKALAHASERVFLLTGTPIMKEADDLFMQLSIIDPLTFTSYWQFINTYCQTYTSRYGTEVYGQRGTLLKRLMDRYGRRCTYDEVGLYLPKIINNFVRVNFTPEHKKAYVSARDAFRVNDIWLENSMQVMHVLRALTGVQEKIQTTIELAQDMDKFLIFTWYRHHAKALAQALDATLIISEEVSPNERKALVAKSERVVCTIGSLSEGVDASHLRNVIFFEEHWTPGSIYQATKRVQRWSEQAEAADTPINMYFVLVKETVDESIHRIQDRRGVNIKDIIKEEMSR